ncbi:MAG: MATE family efflux transporter [Opitutales bacterium]
MHNILAFHLNLKNILKFVLPSMLMMVFLSSYVMVDGIFISHYVGANGLSASNIVYPILNICWAIALMLATGGCALVSRQMGEDKAQLAKETFSAIVYFGLIISVILGAIFMYFLEDVIYFLGSTKELYQYCWDYAVVAILFFPMMMMQVFSQHFLIARGRPKYAMLAIIIAGIVNMVLDYVFIGLFDWGLKGAAFATGIGFSCVGIFGLIYFTKNRIATLYFTRPNLDYKAIVESMTNGSSEMVTQFATALVIFLFNITMMKYVGSQGVAAISVILYLQFLLAAIFLGYATGASPLFSFSFGRQDYTRIKTLFSYSLKICIVLALCIFSFCWVFEYYLVGFFIKEQELFDMTLRGLRFMSISFLFAGFNILASALFTSLSNGKVSAFLSFSRSFLFLAPAIVILPKFWGEIGVWLAIPVAEFTFFLLSMLVIFAYRAKYKYF